MRPELQTLLALQEEDAGIYTLEARLRALEPRLLDMERERQHVADALSRARDAVTAEEKRLHELEGRVATHKQLHERNVSQLDAVRRMREATAAQSQVEQARRILAFEESEMQGSSRRLQELRQHVTEQEQAVADVEAKQTDARAIIETERTGIDAELADARARRNQRAQHVERPLLGKYDRIRGRKGAGTVLPLRGPSCGACDTAVPLHRRSVMAQTGVIEVCEACGVLLYAGEG